MRRATAFNFYSLLLCLYPQNFRARFGEEMTDVFFQGYQETPSRHFWEKLQFLILEYFGVVKGAIIAHWENIFGINRGGFMKPSFIQYWDQKPSNFWESILASIPYFLFTLSDSLPTLLLHGYSVPSQPALDQLYRFALGNPVIWWALTQISKPSYWSGSRVFFQFSNWAFTLLILMGLLFAWRAHWPQWSTTYIGFVLLKLCLYIINRYPDGILIGLGFLIFFALVVFWIARQNLFHALLTALPFATMFFWLISKDGIIGWEMENYLLIIAGFVMTAGLFVGLQTGNRGFTLLTMLVICGVVSGVYAYYTTYYSNAISIPETTPLAVGQGTLFGMFFILLFTVPVWISAAFRWFQMRKA